MARNEREFGCSADDLRDDSYWGDLISSKFPEKTTNYSKFACFGIKKNGVPQVAWCYHSYLKGNSNLQNHMQAEITIASFSTNWNVRKTLKILFYLFFQNNVYNRLTALILPSNRQAVRLVKLAGFTLEGIIRTPEDSENILQFSLLREDWKSGKYYG